MSTDEKHPLLPTTTSDTKLRDAPPPTRRRPSAMFGYFLMVLSAVFQALTTLFFHMAEVTYAIPAGTNLVVLGLMSLILPLLQLAAMRAPLQLPRSAAVPLALRALFGGGTIIFSMLAVSYISAGAFSTTFGLAPIFTTALAALLYREPFTHVHAGSLIVNLLGVALVSHASSPPAHATGYVAAEMMYGYASALAAALCAAGAALAIRRVAGRSDGVSMTAVFGVGCLAIAPLVTRPSDLYMLRTTMRGAACAVLGATSACLSQLFFALALARASAGPAVMVRSLCVPLVFVLALLTMDERVGVSGVVGVVLTIASIAPLALGHDDEREQAVSDEDAKGTGK